MILSMTLLFLLLFILLTVKLSQWYGKRLVTQSLLTYGLDLSGNVMKYFDQCTKSCSLSRSLWDHFRAPIVLLLPLIFLPRSANDLPQRWSYWRNNVSINGDGWAYQDESGKWIQCSNGSEPPGSKPVSYSDPTYTGDAYYAKGHSPRSWYARWIWLAFRNVATLRTKELGPLVGQRPLVVELESNNRSLVGYTTKRFFSATDSLGEMVYGYRAYYQIGKFLFWTNVGARLGIVNNTPEDQFPTRVMITGTWLAIKYGTKVE